MDRVRLAYIVNNLNVGGLEKVVVNLLSEIDRTRFDPHLICLNGPGTLFERVHLPGDRVMVCEKSKGWRLGRLNVDFGLLWSVRRFLRARRVQIVHAHNLGPLIYGGLSSRLLRPHPVVIYSEHNQVYSASPALRRRFRYYLRFAEHTIAVSHDLERYLRKEFSIQGPIHVIHNGIPAPTADSRARADTRHQLGILPNEFLVGTAVVLSKQKGITHLLDAARLMRTLDAPIRFVIAGDGPERRELEAQAESNGLHNVRFLGFRSDIATLVSAFDLYVLPSLWEGLPLALIEALAAGRPIVATAVGGNQEIVEHGVNGLIVPPADPIALREAILQIYHDEAFQRSAATSNVQRFAEAFSLKTMVSAHESLYLHAYRSVNSRLVAQRSVHRPC